MTVGYRTKYVLGDKVKPITKASSSPIMTICAIQLTKAPRGVRATYQVDWFDETFYEAWVEEHQIALYLKDSDEKNS